jgi:hypothetical protein
MMALIDEIRTQIAAYLNHDCDANALFGFLGTVVDRVPNSHSNATNQLWGAAYSALSELSSSEVTEEEARAELASVLNAPRMVGQTGAYAQARPMHNSSTGAHSWGPAYAVVRIVTPSDLGHLLTA